MEEIDKYISHPINTPIIQDLYELRKYSQLFDKCQQWPFNKDSQRIKFMYGLNTCLQKGLFVVKDDSLVKLAKEGDETQKIIALIGAACCGDYIYGDNRLDNHNDKDHSFPEDIVDEIFGIRGSGEKRRKEKRNKRLLDVKKLFGEEYSTVTDILTDIRDSFYYDE